MFAMRNHMEALKGAVQRGAVAPSDKPLVVHVALEVQAVVQVGPAAACASSGQQGGPHGVCCSELWGCRRKAAADVPG
jgi:hypothetical protein